MILLLYLSNRLECLLYSQILLGSKGQIRHKSALHRSESFASIWFDSESRIKPNRVEKSHNRITSNWIFFQESKFHLTPLTQNLYPYIKYSLKFVLCSYHEMGSLRSGTRRRSLLASRDQLFLCIHYTPPSQVLCRLGYLYSSTCTQLVPYSEIFTPPQNRWSSPQFYHSLYHTAHSSASYPYDKSPSYASFSAL